MKTSVGWKGRHTAASNCGIISIICRNKRHVAYSSNNTTMPPKLTHFQPHKPTQIHFIFVGINAYISINAMQYKLLK